MLRIGDYIAENNPAGALRVVRDLRAKCKQLTVMPMAYPIVPRFEHLRLRRRVVGNHLIFYVSKQTLFLS